jgi:type III secretion system YscQ/HrcQ family protein
MAPLAWVRRIAAELPELNPIPLFGNAPSFDWTGFSLFPIHPKEQCWREASEIAKGLGADLLTLPVAVSPLGTVFWIMSRVDMIKLTSSMMKSGKSEIVQEGFYRYLALEALNTIQGMEPLKELTLQLTEEEMPFEKAFCIDITIKCETKSCWGRLVIPIRFRSAWVQHFSAFPSEYVPTEAARQTELAVAIKTGSVTLRQEEWEQIKVGDFVLLDQGGYDPHKGTGIALVSLQTIPIFNAKIKHNKIELIDYAFTHEETMEPNKEEVVALKELPLYVTVEIGRFKITLDELMHLTPGNTLDLPIHSDQSVSLTVNGQKVGRAELIYLGEQLGLRILEI